MKKIMLTLGLIGAVALFGSCDLKTCYCCQAVGNTAVEEETYTDINGRCSSLNNSTRTCLEASERIDCSQVAIGYKKK